MKKQSKKKQGFFGKLFGGLDKKLEKKSKDKKCCCCEGNCK